jgi:amino acid permease
MKQKRIMFLFPLSAFIGTVFGVGLYSLPYVMSRSGVWLFLFYLIVVGLLVYLVNAMFAEVAIQTPIKERFLGYIGQYIGKRTERIFGWITVVGFWGTFLAYLLVWGQFAHNVFGKALHLDPVHFSIIFFAFTFFIIYKGGRTVEAVDIIMLVAAGMLFITLFGLGFNQLRHVVSVPTATLSWILPYGTIMFAMWGAGIIPEVVNQLRESPNSIRRLLRIGLIIPMCVAFVFALFIVGLSGSETSRESFAGLGAVLGNGAVVVGSLIGMITIALAYNNLGWVSRNMFMTDLKLSHVSAMLLSLAPALVLIFLGIHNFIIVISLSGAIFLGLQGYIIFQLYHKVIHKNGNAQSQILRRAIPPWLIRLGMALFVAGVVLELGIVLYEELLSVIE